MVGSDLDDSGRCLQIRRCCECWPSAAEAAICVGAWMVRLEVVPFPGGANGL